MTRACAGCLGTTECWICTGDGCHRCAASGRCHVCVPEQVLQLIPRQSVPQHAVATSAP